MHIFIRMSWNIQWNLHTYAISNLQSESTKINSFHHRPIESIIKSTFFVLLHQLIESHLSYLRNRRGPRWSSLTGKIGIPRRGFPGQIKQQAGSPKVKWCNWHTPAWQMKLYRFYPYVSRLQSHDIISIHVGMFHVVSPLPALPIWGFPFRVNCKCSVFILGMLSELYIEAGNDYATPSVLCCPMNFIIIYVHVSYDFKDINLGLGCFASQFLWRKEVVIYLYMKYHLSWNNCGIYHWFRIWWDFLIIINTEYLKVSDLFVRYHLWHYFNICLVLYYDASETMANLLIIVLLFGLLKKINI